MYPDPLPKRDDVHEASPCVGADIVVGDDRVDDVAFSRSASLQA